MIFCSNKDQTIWRNLWYLRISKIIILQRVAMNFSDSSSRTLYTCFTSLSGVERYTILLTMRSTKLNSSYPSNSLLFFSRYGFTFFSSRPLYIYKYIYLNQIIAFNTYSNRSQLKANEKSSVFLLSLMGGIIERISLSSFLISSSVN